MKPLPWPREGKVIGQMRWTGGRCEQRGRVQVDGAGVRVRKMTRVGTKKQWLLVALFVVSVTPLLGARPEKDRLEIDGSWEGTFADEIATGKLYLNLFQVNEESVVGTYTSSLGGGGTIVGLLSGSTLEFELTPAANNCPGTYKGYLMIHGDSGVGMYSGTDCLGPHEKGMITVSRLSPRRIPVQIPQEENPSVNSPDVEYGYESELRNVKSVYVYTGRELGVRNDIIKNLKKDKALAVIDDRADADAVLVFNWDGKYGTPARGYAVVGTRLVWEYKDVHRTKLERSPSTKFARKFSKLLKRLRRGAGAKAASGGVKK